MGTRNNGRHPRAESGSRPVAATLGRRPVPLVGRLLVAGSCLVSATSAFAQDAGDGVGVEAVPAEGGGRPPPRAAAPAPAEAAPAGAEDERAADERGTDTGDAASDDATSDDADTTSATDEAAGEAEPAEGADAAAKAKPSVRDPAAPPTDAIPGSHRPPGLGLSPEAPPTPPAPGGRAPSFGAPTPPSEWVFAITGRMSAWESVGLAERPDPAPAGYEGTSLHVPALVTGKQPFWAGAGLALNFAYGNPRVSANVSLWTSLNGIERRGFHDPSVGPDIAVAYLAYTPEPIGAMQLRAKVGAFRENFGGPGQWGWGIFGPLIGVKGYGESLAATYPLSPKTQLELGQGVSFVPAFPEEYVRGAASGWAENARSTWVHHEHAGVSYQNQYVFKLHYASAQGTDERTYLADDEATAEVELPRDGHLNVLVAEARAAADPYGQLGISAGYWDFDDAYAVHDGIWWGIDWTAGGRELTNKFLGAESDGNGKLGAISAEYGLSVARILWHPGTFDGRSPDIRIKVAGILHGTFDSDDDRFDGTLGYLLGSEIEYQMVKWLSATLRGYGENRYLPGGRYADYSLTPSLVFKRDWQSADRIEVAYSRMFYGDLVDVNSAAPYDRNIFTLGAVVSF